MPALNAGEDFLLLDVRLYWADRFSKLPPIDHPYDTTWPSPWVEVIDTVNGVQVTHRNPTVAVVSEQRDRIGSVRNQGAGTAIQFQALTFTDAFWTRVGARTKKSVAASTEARNLNLTSGITTNTSITVRLNGVNYVASPTTTQSTPALLATYLRTAANYTPVMPTGATGWTIGGTGADVTYTAGSSGTRNAGTYSYTGGGANGGAGTMTRLTIGHHGFGSSYVDPDKEHTLMIGVEGLATAGSIFSQPTIVRGIAYRAENTANAVDVFRRTGADSLLRPNVTLECLPEQVRLNAATMLAETGITEAELDTYQKFNHFTISTEAAV